MVSKSFGYARVSTGDQNLDLQLDALQQANCDAIYKEKASSAKAERTELRELFKVVREGDKIIVWRLDRLARSTRQLIETVEDLNSKGVELISLQESVDTSNAGGKLIFHIFSALAEFERNLIKERVNAGLKSARERGRFGGRPKALSQPQIKIARAMRQDHSLAEIASHLGVAKSTVHRALK